MRPELTPRRERPDSIFSQRTQVLMDDVGRGPETPSARPARSEHISRGRGRDPDRLAYLWPGPIMFRTPGGHPDARWRIIRRLALAEIPSPQKALCPGGIRLGWLESRVLSSPPGGQTEYSALLWQVDKNIMAGRGTRPFWRKEKLV